MSARPALDQYPELSQVIPDVSQDSEDSEEIENEEIATQKIPETYAKPRAPLQKNITDLYPICVAIIAIILGLMSVIVAQRFIKQDNTPITSKKDWKQIVTELHPHLRQKGNKFPSQKEDVWYQILSGLKQLTDDPKRPAVYLLTHDESSEQSSSCIAEIITTAANKYLLDKNGWSLLNGSSLLQSTNTDPGDLITAVSNAVQENKIIIITDIQDIPAKLAQGFHFLVDEYNPKVAEAIYVLTLKIPTKFKGMSPVKAAEEALLESWKDLNFDTLQPLVTRMTIQVLPIMAEKVQNNCPLKTSVTNEIYIY